MGLMAVSCYDDSALWDTVNDHEQRIVDLETKCKELNANIQSLQTLVDASKTGDAVTSVTPLKEGDVEIGYTLTFASGKTINVYHGKDGADAKMPEIGAAASDGVLCWTVGGEFVLDAEGNKIPVAGKDGITPQFKVEGSVWYVSYDGGTTWAAVETSSTGADAPLFKDITYDDDYVYFTLPSGEGLVVPRSKPFDILFINEDQAFFPGEEIVVGYELTGGDEYSQVKAFGPEGWTVTVEEGEDNTKGYIHVTSALEYRNGDVTVLVSDGRSKTFIRTLSFKYGELVAAVSTFNVDADATSLDIDFSTNFNYWVTTNVDWITVPEPTKAEMRNETVTVTFSENTTHEQRQGSVIIASMNGYIIEEFIVYQFGVPYDAWYLVGGFNDWTCADENYKMTRDGDMFVYKNFETTGTELKFNIGSWDVERTGRFSAADYASVLLPYGDNMEIPAGKYDVYMDKNAFTVYFMTEGKTPADAAEKFVLESGKYWIVAGGSWSGFAEMVAGPLAEDATYGYLPAETPGFNEWYGLSSSMANAYTFTAIEDGGYTIQDSYGRYLHQIKTYDSYNVSYDLPAEGYVWDVYVNKYNYFEIVNREKEKVMMIDLNYGTFGCYASGSDTRYLPYLVKAEETSEDVEPSENVWGLVGTHNSWTAPDIPMEEVDGMYVAYNMVFDQEVNEFKIRANEEWNDAANYGLAIPGAVEPDHYYSLICGGSSGNVTVGAGTYDVWFDLAESKLYVMTPGKSVTEAQDGMADAPQLGDAWYMVGTFNNWTCADENYKMTLVDGWYVYSGFVTDGSAELKFNAGGWDVNRGGTFTAANEPMAVYHDGGNIIPAAGTYDIYMAATTDTVYFMTTGMKPGEKPAAGAEGNHILVEASEMVEAAWDTQFFITFADAFEEGDTWEISMAVKADEVASISPQTHKGAGGYLHWAAIGTVPFTTEWTLYTASGTASAEMAGGNAIAFNLNDYAPANKYYFDNISFKVNGVEQIVNGDLSDPYTNENFLMKQYGKNNGGVVPAHIVNTSGSTGYALTMTNAEAGENNWSVQCWYQLDEPLKANTDYEFKYVAKATSQYDWCSIFLQSSTTDDQNYNHGISFGTEWTAKTYIINAGDVATFDKLTFNLGDFAGTLYLDNVSLKEVGSDVELISNGDFETGTTDGWSSWTNVQGLGEGY